MKTCKTKAGRENYRKTKCNPYDFEGDVGMDTWMRNIKLAFKVHDTHKEEYKLSISLCL